MFSTSRQLDLPLVQTPLHGGVWVTANHFIETMAADGATHDDLEAWKEVTQKTALLLDPKATVESFWKSGTRADGRLWSQCRSTRVQTGVLLNMAGSAVVQMGSTRVMAAVVLQVGQVVVVCSGEAAAATDRGDVMVTCANNPVLQSYLQRTLQETTSLEQLVIPTSSNNSAFLLHVMLQVLDTDGNLEDASLLACVAALSDTKLPSAAAIVVDHDGRIWLQRNDPSPQRLAQSTIPISLTIGLWRSTENEAEDMIRLFVDPTKQEEFAIMGRISVVVDAGRDDNLTILCIAMSAETQAVALDPSTMVLAAKLAQGRATELKPLLTPVRK